MRTVALGKLLPSMQPGTALLGLCFNPRALSAAVTTSDLNEPKQIPHAASLNAESLLKVVKEFQVLPSDCEQQQSP